MRYYEKTTPAHQNNGHLREEEHLKSVERITPSRHAPSFARIFILPVAAAVTLAALAAYGLWPGQPDPLVALAVGAIVGLLVGYWRVQVWDSQPTDAVERREWFDRPTAEPTALYQPIITNGRPGNQQIKYGKFSYSAQAWKLWAQVLQDNDWHITREILNQVRINGRCIFTNLTSNFNDVVGEMHRLGWTTDNKSDLSEAGIVFFQQLLDPPTPANPPGRRP